MSNFLDRIIGYFSPVSGLRRDQARLQQSILAKNGFDAAGEGRRNELTHGSDSNANTEIRVALPSLRMMSRELVRNNPFAAKAVNVIVSNTIGTGIRAAAQSQNKKRKDLAGSLFSQWADDINFYAIESMVMRAMVESGDVFIIREIKNNKLSLKILEGDHLDTVNHEGHSPDGSWTEQGIQFSPDGDREGYWFYKKHPGDRTGLSQYKSEFFTSKNVIHLYAPTRPGQNRGIPWGASGFMRLKGIDDFQDARVEQMKVAACLAGFIVDDQNSGSKGDLLPEKLEPGMLPKLGYGQDIRFNNPPGVSGHEEFVSTELHAVAAAYGVSYEALTGDLKQVNYSSGRMGFLEFQRNLTRWQTQIIIPAFCKRVEQWFLESEGLDKTDVVFKWTPPRREMVDPTKEIPAMIKAVRAGFKPWQETIREMGYDPSAIALMIKDDNDLFDRHDFILDVDPRNITNGGQMQQENKEVGNVSEE